MLIKRLIISLLTAIIFINCCQIKITSCSIAENLNNTKNTSQIEVLNQKEDEMAPIKTALVTLDCEYIPNLSIGEIQKEIIKLQGYKDFLFVSFPYLRRQENKINNLINLYEKDLEYLTKWQKKSEEYPIATKIWLYMKNEFGWSDEACAGIMGNIMAEVGGGSEEGALLLTAWKTDTPYGLGLFQWTGTEQGSRRMKIKAAYGENPTIEEQLQFMYYEVTGINNAIASPRYCKELSVMFTCNSPEQNALTFAVWFEGCQEFSYGARQNYARFAYNYFTK